MTPKTPRERMYETAAAGCASDPVRAGRELTDLRMEVADLHEKMALAPDRLARAFKRWIVKRPNGGCQVLLPLSELDATITAGLSPVGRRDLAMALTAEPLMVLLSEPYFIRIQREDVRASVCGEFAGMWTCFIGYEGAVVSVSGTGSTMDDAIVNALAAIAHSDSKGA